MMNKRSGLFFTFEGIDGCGKTTQADLLEAWLVRFCGRDRVVRTREPGGWSGGQQVRDTLLHGNLQHPWSELYLFMYDRCEHIAQVILPNLNEGRIVLCERYHASTMAYQGWGRGMPVAFLRQLGTEAAIPVPDAILFLDVSIQTALARLGGRSCSDRFEGEGGLFLDRVREGFLELSQTDNPSSWCRLDADASIEGIHKEIVQQLTPLMRGYEREDFTNGF